MSFPGISLAAAEVEAQTIVDGISPYCTRIEIVGSIRRRKENVNDIDIALVWEGAGFGLLTFFKKHGILKSTGGDRIIKFKWPPMQIPVQLFQTNAAGWPSELLIRTGSKDHNIRMCARALRMQFKLSVGKGLIDERRYPYQPIPGIETEHDIFQALGMEYVEPKDRR